MRFNRHFFGFVLSLSVLTIGSEGSTLAAFDQVEAATTCDVTEPNGIVAGTDQPDAHSYGNRHISVGPFGLWPEGTVVFKPGGPGFVTRDGALGMKFGWTRGVRGQLRIEGRRLDAPAPLLRSEVNNGYGSIGFHASYVVFP
ncbi:MAG: hypothetical protein ACRD2A_15205, partial [Vicinamibacterales bacterium]